MKRSTILFIVALLGAFLSIYATEERGAKEAKGLKKVVLPADWTVLKIEAGAGSCWGEGTSPYMIISKTAVGGEITINRVEGEESKPRKVDAKELERITKRLVEFCNHSANFGKRVPNYWLLHRIELRRAGTAKASELYSGPCAVQSKKSEQFQIWLRSLHPDAKELPAESHWKEQRERKKAEDAQD